MEFVNPFKRREKKDFIPVSVFPASKMTRTSMQIGRAVPVYTIEVIKNNKWRVSINQLTRFMTMDKPVMNDFEVNFGAFYVPYVALDRVTGSSLYAKFNSTSAQLAAFYGLNARQFFDPSTSDSDRVKCIKRSVSLVGNNKLVGSLWDHLQYPTFSDVDIFHLTSAGNISSSFTALKTFTLSSGSIVPVGIPIRSIGEIFTYGSEHTTSFGAALGVYTENYSWIGSDNNVIRCMPFDIWCMLNPEFNFTALKQLNGSGMSFEQLTRPFGWSTMLGTPPGKLAGTILPPSPTADQARQLELDVVPFAALMTGGSSYLDIEWSKYFGKYTREQVYDLYWAYLHNSYIVQSGCGSSALFSLYPILTYLRIYGDYFLNPLISDKEEFFKYSSAIYCYLAANVSDNLRTAVTSVYSSYGSNPNMEFYFNYFNDMECFPVLWEKDFFTSAQIRETSGSDVTIANGDTIPTLFYKRMYQRFKDLIARMGQDYKINSDALYGGTIPDETLQRSQVIGFKKFNVKVGAIANTSSPSESGNLADFGGYAYSTDSTDSFEWTAQENGLIMILCWIRPLYTAVSTAVPRHLIKDSYLDYLLPQFAGVGYQDIPNILLNPSVPSANLNTKFGIQERYFEYYTMLNESSGAFHDTARQYAVDREFIGVQQLSETGSPKILYITPDDEVNRIFTDRSHDPILASIYFDGVVTRQAPAEIRTDF